MKDQQFSFALQILQNNHKFLNLNLLSPNLMNMA